MTNSEPDRDIPLQHQARTGDGRTISATQGIVPICIELSSGQLQVVGTGFYITRYGLFLTARHVFDHVIQSRDPGAHTIRVFHDTGTHIHIRHVRRFCWSHEADVALGEADNFIDRYPADPLVSLRGRITFDVPREGEPLVLFAYPRNHLLDLTEKSKPVPLFADRFDGRFVGIRAPGNSPSNKVELFQTTIQIEGGASGGPVFNENSDIVGIARSSFDFGVVEDEPVSFVTPLRHCAALNLESLQLLPSYWEHQQLPENHKAGPHSFEDLIKYGHIDFIRR